MTVYEENGYKDRTDYLKSLAEDYDMSFQTVYLVAQMLGPSEDFDGLINALEDAESLGV